MPQTQSRSNYDRRQHYSLHFWIQISPLLAQMVRQVSFLPFDVKKEGEERTTVHFITKRKTTWLIFLASIFHSNIQVIFKTVFLLIFYLQASVRNYTNYNNYIEQIEYAQTFIIQLCQLFMLTLPIQSGQTANYSSC